jgi:divalent metal cation (Fe/Co/Zn/Cd) transporter
MHQPIPIISILVGALVLLFGRRLFWLFVAAVGFWIGFEATPHLMQNPPPWLALAVAVGLGLLGALLAFLLQKVAIALSLLAAFVNTHASYSGIAFVVGGILGTILLLALFDWALIVFSAIVGAELIISHLHIPQAGATILLLGLTTLGILVQAALFRRRRV